MSNYLAIATVTAALSQALREAINVEFSGAEVTNARPHSVNDGGAAEIASVNLYLYQVTRNTALSNADLPTRNSRGQVCRKPAAAIDLHYLMTFYGNQAELEPERLAGIVIRTMHTHSVLSRKLIQDTVGNSMGFPYLANSNLADSVEQVKFSQIPFSLEELSKLWSVFLQTSYTLSVAFVGTVVLIESEDTPISPLPVRARNIYVRPFAQAVIEDIKIQDVPGNSLQRADAESILLIQGRGLSGDITSIKVAGQVIKLAASDINSQQIRLDLNQFSLLPGETSNDPFKFPMSILRAGSLPIQVEHQQLIGTPQTPHVANASNVAVVMLAPKISVNKISATDTTTFEINVQPLIHKEQHVVLLLNQLAVDNPESYALVAPERTSDEAITQVDFVIQNSEVKPGNYLLRLQVDGAQSELGVVNDVYEQPQESIP